MPECPQLSPQTPALWRCRPPPKGTSYVSVPQSHTLWPRAAPGRLSVATEGWSECPGLLGCVHGGQGCSAKGDFAGPVAWFPGSGRLPPAPHPSGETQR